MKSKKVLNIICYIILILVLFFTLLPLIYTVLSSFKTNSEIMAHPENLWPENFTLDNYKIAMTSRDFNIPLMLWNSIYYTLICVVGTVITSSMAGYVFARGEFPGKNIIFVLFSSLMFISLGSITIYPTFAILSKVKLANSLWGLIVMKILGISTVNIYLVRSYVKTLPTAMEEAAEIDGCSFVGTFFRVVWPLLKPIIATITILAFMGSWNEYLLPTLFTMTKPEQKTLIVGVVSLKNSSDAAAAWNLMLAGATIALLPVIILYTFASKYFIKGLASGAVKG